MKQKMLFAIATAALAMAPAAFCQSTDTGSSTLDITVGPEAQFTAVDSTTSLTGDTKFGAKTGTTNFTYKLRTTQSGGSGSITVEVTAFATGGPAMTDLTYGCTSGVGTACSSGTAVSTTAQTNVVTFGTDAHSADAGTSGTTAWTLVDKPSTKTGSYSSTATFTISAS
ncbi:MAG TPA: hypothetical protein VGH38_11255 [Bryobacteraceae bacterium]|jgi:hypothetical protein